MGVEWASAQLLLRSLADGVKLLEKLFIGSFSLACIAHLSHLLHEFTNTFAVLEWAASLESRAISSQAFAFLDKDDVRAHSFAKSWALEHHVIQSDAHGGLEKEEKRAGFSNR